MKDLTEEQREIVETWGEGLAVIAGAGCGKTTTLVSKCKRLLERNPSAQFAAISFTERSANDLKARLLALGRQHWVMTIHGLCQAVVRDFPEAAGLIGQERVLSESEAGLYWERAMQRVWYGDISVERLMERETFLSIGALLARVKDLRMQGAIESLAGSTDPEAAELGKLGESVLKIYDRLKEKDGVLDFSDLERLASRALENVEIREYYHRRFDFVAVDEFQDTSPVQLSIVEKFARPGFNNLCVIGDPKQAIYGFRDADVTLFEEFVRRMPKVRCLTWNFRSVPEVIDLVNRTCAPCFAASGLEYIPLVARRQSEGATAATQRIEVASPEAFANWLKSKTSSGELRDPALLLRQIRGNEPWLEALLEADVPLSINGGSLYWENPRVREMTCLLKWWAQPYQSMSGAAFLRAPWVGVSDNQLDEWLRSGGDLLSSFLKSEHPVAQVLRPLQGRAISPGELLLALGSIDSIEREMGVHLLGLWHRAERLSLGGMDFLQVALEFGRAMEEGRRERDLPPVRLKGQVVVSTLHAAKGLEYSEVILLDFFGKKRTAAAPLLFWDRTKGAFLCKRLADGTRDAEAESEWRNELKERSLRESKRLFYVGLTRAKDRLFLIFEQKEDEAPPTDASLVEDNWRAWIGPHIPGALQPLEVKKEVERQYSFELPEARGNLVAKPRVRRARHSVSEWSALKQCPRKYEWTYVRPKIPLDSEELTEVGTQVHACLEAGNWSDLPEGPYKREELVKYLDISAKSGWMRPAGENREVWKELGFEVPLGGEILVGAVDRLVCEDGKYTLIDFKVSSRAEKDLVQQYTFQLALYAWAVRTLVGDPKMTLRAVIVALGREGVKEIPVPLPEWIWEREPPELLHHVEVANGILEGREGVPLPGMHCRACDFRRDCPEGFKALNQSPAAG